MRPASRCEPTFHTIHTFHTSHTSGHFPPPFHTSHPHLPHPHRWGSRALLYEGDELEVDSPTRMSYIQV